MKYVIANWKANKTIEEARMWMETFLHNDFSLIKDQFQIIIASPFHALTTVYQLAEPYSFISIAAQDISTFPEGPYTGEIAGEMLTGLAKYVLIGHSERRKLLHETDEMLAQKVAQAQQNHITPIFFLNGERIEVPKDVRFIVYEPAGAIGVGNQISVDHVIAQRQRIDQQKKYIYLYGGSVDETNSSDYLNSVHIDGIIIGTACLDPDRFYQLIKTVLT